MTTMTFDAAPSWRPTERRPTTWRPPAQPRNVFRPGEAVVVLMGATALGTTLGFIGALLVGREGSAPVQASVWLSFGFIFLWASKILVQLVRQRAWTPVLFYTLHLFAYALWPFTVMLWAPDAVTFWLGLFGLVGALLAFLIWSGKRPLRLVFQFSGLAILISSITSLQAMLIAFGD